MLLVGCQRVWRTTLAAPFLWATFVIVLLTLVAERHYATGGVSPLLRFVAAAATFSPLMAVLGAKRPQHWGWQWVVASLWAVLVWPAGQAALAGTGMDLFVAWKLFLLALVGMGLVNYLPTRYWSAAMLVAVGQLALLWEFLWPHQQQPIDHLPLAGLASFLAATVAAFLSHRWNAKNQESNTLESHTTRWLSFRDAFGLLWGLRILGRVNETAELKKWPMRLHWNGFQLEANTSPSETQLQELDDAFATLMRRFW